MLDVLGGFDLRFQWPRGCAPAAGGAEGLLGARNTRLPTVSLDVEQAGHQLCSLWCSGLAEALMVVDWLVAPLGDATAV